MKKTTCIAFGVAWFTLVACTPASREIMVNIGGKTYPVREEYSVGSLGGNTDSYFTLVYKNVAFTCSGVVTGCIRQAEAFERRLSGRPASPPEAPAKPARPTPTPPAPPTADTRGD